jgi:hypothetical protein
MQWSSKIGFQWRIYYFGRSFCCCARDVKMPVILFVGLAAIFAVV